MLTKDNDVLCLSEMHPVRGGFEYKKAFCERVHILWFPFDDLFQRAFHNKNKPKRDRLQTLGQQDCDTQ